MLLIELEVFRSLIFITKSVIITVKKQPPTLPSQGKVSLQFETKSTHTHRESASGTAALLMQRIQWAKDGGVNRRQGGFESRLGHCLPAAFSLLVIHCHALV